MVGKVWPMSVVVTATRNITCTSSTTDRCWCNITALTQALVFGFRHLSFVVRLAPSIDVCI